MKIIQASNGKNKIKKISISKLDWERIGRKAGWVKESAKRNYKNFEVIEPSEVRGILESFGGRRFWLGYRKKDNSFRSMEAQLHVDKMSSRPGYESNPQYNQMLDSKDLIVIFDLNIARKIAQELNAQDIDDPIERDKKMKGAYRRIYPKRVEIIHGGGKEYIVSTAVEPWIVEKLETGESFAEMNAMEQT